MIQLLLYIGFAVLVLGAAAILLRRPRAGLLRETGGSAVPVEFFPVHCRYFFQMRHAFSGEDAAYLARRGSPDVCRRWRKAVRRARRTYLAALREDFSRLNRLARLLALYSPQVQARQEAELLLLNLHFQLFYAIVLLRFWLGRPSADPVGQIASLIGSLGSRLEQAALALNVPSGALTP
jgi:hypothetical protein